MGTESGGIKNSLKATGLFGGVQIFQILISVINSKFVAVLLGPVGIGILGLLTSTTSVISQITGLGLKTSAIRDVSSSFSSGDEPMFNKTVTVFRRLVWLTGSLGCVACLALSPFLSKLNFGDYRYTWAFVFLSVTLLFTQISQGQTVVLTGTKRFKEIALSGVIGSSLGLVISVPIYYAVGQKGIVPVLIVQSVVSLCLSYYFSRRVKVETVKVSWRETFRSGNVMIKLGFFVALQGFWSLFFSYIIRLFISKQGGLSDVGLFNSGFNIINTYVGLVFTAMATEYYPRLSALADNSEGFKTAVNEQVWLGLLLLSPLVAIFCTYSDLAISLLYSTKFLGATNMIMLGIFGVFFKAPGWCMGYMFLAKGDTKAFFYNELSAQVVMTALNLAFYCLGDLTGLGLSYIIGYLYYDVQCYFICRRRYGYTLDLSLFAHIAPQVLLSLTILCISMYVSSSMKYVVGSVLSVLSCLLFYHEMSKIVDVKAFIKSKLKRGSC